MGLCKYPFPRSLEICLLGSNIKTTGGLRDLVYSTIPRGQKMIYMNYIVGNRVMSIFFMDLFQGSASDFGKECMCVRTWRHI